MHTNRTPLKENHEPARNLATRPFAAALLAAVLGIVLALAPSPAAADEPPPPHRIFRKILNRQAVMRATGAAHVQFNAQPQAETGQGIGKLEDGILLFPDATKPDGQLHAIQVRVLMILAANRTQAQATYDRIPLPGDKNHALLSQPVARAIGDKASTCRVLESHGTDTKINRAEGKLLRGRYALALYVIGDNQLQSPQQLERMLIALLKLLGWDLPLTGTVVPDDSSIVRVNQAPKIESLKLLTPNNEGLIEHDKAIKLVAKVTDADGDKLTMRWQVRDADGRELYTGAGKNTRTGNTLVCQMRSENGPAPKGPLQVTLHVDDDHGGSDSITQKHPITRPLAKLIGWFGEIQIKRKFKRMQTLRTKDLYDGDKITVFRDEEFLFLTPEERLTLNYQKEILTFVDVEWPKYGAKGRFLTRASAPTRWFTVVIGRRPPGVRRVSEAMRYAIDQLCSVSYEYLRDKGVEALISRLPQVAGAVYRRTAAPLYEIAMSAGSLAGDSVFVELHSRIAIKSDGHGGVGMYTLEGAPIVLEPNGRRRFTFPTGTWASIDEHGAHERGRFDPSQLDPVWDRVDDHLRITDLARLEIKDAHGDGSGPMAWVLVLAGLLATGVLGRVWMVRRRGAAEAAARRRERRLERRRALR